MHNNKFLGSILLSGLTAASSGCRQPLASQSSATMNSSGSPDLGATPPSTPPPTNPGPTVTTQPPASQVATPVTAYVPTFRSLEDTTSGATVAAAMVGSWASTCMKASNLYSISHLTFAADHSVRMNINFFSDAKCSVPTAPSADQSSTIAALVYTRYAVGDVLPGSKDNSAHALNIQHHDGSIDFIAVKATADSLAFAVADPSQQQNTDAPGTRGTLFDATRTLTRTPTSPSGL